MRAYLARGAIFVGVAVAIAVMVSPAAAATTVIGFDDQPSGTALGEQYAALGVHLGPSPFPSLSGAFTAVARAQARSGPNVAAFAYDSGTDFSSSWIKFDKQQSHVSFYACRTGGSSDPPQPNVNVVAYDSNGNVVDNQTGIVCNLNGSLVPVTVQKDHISYLNVYGGGGSAAPGNGWGLDDLTFDSNPPPQPPPPLPPKPPPPPPPDFSLDFLQGPTTANVLAVAPGGSATRQLVVGRNDTSTGPVQLSASGLPDGVTATFNPATASSDRAQIVTMTISADRSAIGQFATVTVRGSPQAASAGAQAHTTTLDMIVQTQLAAHLKGIEITQGVQTINQPNVSPYQGVVLVSGKKTVARVYAGFIGLESLSHRSQVPLPELGMSLYGQSHGGVNLPGSPLIAEWSPSSFSLTLNDTFPLGPGDLGSSGGAFVFTLPDSWTTKGSIALSARPLAASEPSPFNRPQATSATLCIEQRCGATPFRDLNNIPFRPAPPAQALNAVEQDLTYRDAKGNVTSTTRPVDAVRTFARLIQISPVPFTFLDSANNPSPIPRYRAVRDAPTDKIWEDADAFDQQIGRVGHSTFGAFNSAKDAGVTFTARTSVGTSDPGPGGNPNRPLTVIAHEVLHTFGLGHADQSAAAGGCGGNGGGFPDPKGRLNSVGIDTLFLSGGGVGSPPYRVIPDTSKTPGYDLMSYCATLGGGDPNSWISAINWNAMLAAGAPPASRDQGAAIDPTKTNTLHVRARADRSGARIESVGRSTGPSLPSPASSYLLVTRDRQGRTLSSVTMTSANVEAAAGEAPGFSVLDGQAPAAGVTSVQITAGGSVLASRSANATPPSATFSSPKAGARVGVGRSVTVRWRSSGANGGPVEVELDYSADGGRTFHNVYGGGTGNSAVLPASLFQPSTRARLRLRLNDGFNDAHVLSRSFVVAPRPPQVAILDPVARQPVATGSSLYLRGGAVDAAGRAIPSRRLRWLAGKTVIGRGERISAVLPAATRSIRLVAVDRSGRSGTASVTVIMRATTPYFLSLKTPRSLSRRARLLTLTASTTEPALLRIGGLRIAVDRHPQRVHVHVKPGRSTLRLRLRLSAGGKGIVQPVVVPRR